MLLYYVTSAFVFGLCNTGLALSGKLQRTPIFQVPAGSLFWPFRYYWRIVTLISIWCTYGHATRLFGVLPVACAFGYEVYLIATIDRQVLTPQTLRARLPKTVLFCIVPVVQLAFIWWSLC